MRALLRRFGEWFYGVNGWFIADDPDPEYGNLDKDDGLGRGEAEDWERFWDFEKPEKDDLQRYIAGDYPA